jgi:tetratricopeptide (TPR) repeat protein
MKRMIFTGILALASGLAAFAMPQAPAQPKPPSPKSPAEGQAYMALVTASQGGDPAAIIKAADELVTKFADTDFKGIALSLEAKAYQSKNDPEHAQIYALQALQTDPKNYSMTLLLGEVISQHIGDHDLDRADKVARSTKYFNDTLELLKTAPKPQPQLTDDQWSEYKKYTAAETHNGLGLLALLNAGVAKDADKPQLWETAIKEFKDAVADDPQDAYNTRLAKAYQGSGKNDEAIAICDKLLAKPDLHPTIKRFASQIKDDATRAKGAK